MKVQIEIEIPDGHEIVSVHKGSILTHLDNVEASKAGGAEVKHQVFVYTRPAKPLLINGVPSDWPEWLVCDWVAKERDGAIYGYTGGPPEIRVGIWTTVSGGYLGRIFGTTLEIPGPWEESLRENSRRKK